MFRRSCREPRPTTDQTKVTLKEFLLSAHAGSAFMIKSLQISTTCCLVHTSSCPLTVVVLQNKHNESLQCSQPHSAIQTPQTFGQLCFEVSVGERLWFLFQNGADDVKKHRWFKAVDWEAVPLRKLKVSLLCKTALSEEQIIQTLSSQLASNIWSYDKRFHFRIE